jgi:hypothetical protein
VKTKLLLAALSLLLFGAGAEVAVRVASPEMWLPGEDEPEGIMHRRSPDPLLVYELRPGARIRFPRERGQGTVTLEVNALGLRDRPGLAHQKPAGGKRVLVVGDSIVFGLGVELEETLAKRLEAELRARGLETECIGVAVSGYDALQAVQLLRTKGLAFGPHLVVFAYNLTDAMDFSGELGQFFEALTYSEPMPGDGLRRAVLPWSQAARWVFWRLSRRRAPDVAKAKQVQRAMEEARRAYIEAVLARHRGEPEVSAVLPSARRSTPPLPEPWNGIEESYLDPRNDRRRRAAWLDLLDAGHERGVPVLMAVIPAFVDRRPYPFADLEAALLADAQRLGLETVSLSAVLEHAAVDALSYDSLHPTAAGHAALASRLADSVWSRLSPGAPPAE